MVQMNTGREVKSLLSQMDLVVPLCWYYWRVGEFLKSEFPTGMVAPPGA
jgi:hypothetical protein